MLFFFLVYRSGQLQMSIMYPLLQIYFFFLQYLLFSDFYLLSSCKIIKCIGRVFVLSHFLTWTIMSYQYI